MHCVFCEKPEIKERAITENEFAFVFPTNIPIVPGHVLISPKRCVADYSELTSEERAAIEDLRQKMHGALTKAFGAQGFNYAWNESKFAGQSVPHFHLHMLPRTEGDTGIYQYEPREFLYRPGSREESPEAELLDVVRLIQLAL